jgi:DNA polymerase-3 subunit beta
MTLTIPRSTLLDLLIPAASIAPKKPSNPALGHVLLDLDPAGIAVEATDTAIRLAMRTGPARRQGEVLTVDAADLLNVVRSLAAGDVTLDTGTNGRLIVSAAGSEFRLPTTGGEDYPPPQSHTWRPAGSIEGDALARVIGEVTYAASTDENRYGLNGIHCETSGGILRLASTDGSRLAWSECSREGDGEVLLAKLAAADCGTWTVEAADSAVSWTSPGGTRLSMRLIEGEFPDYRQVMPKGWTRSVEVRTADLSGGLKRASIVASDKNHTITMSVASASLDITTRSHDTGDMSESVPAEVNGESMQIGVNARMMLDALGSVDSSSVALEMGEPLDPIVLRWPGRSDVGAIVMPMRID